MSTFSLFSLRETLSAVNSKEEHYFAFLAWIDDKTSKLVYTTLESKERIPVLDKLSIYINCRLEFFAFDTTISVMLRVLLLGFTILAMSTIAISREMRNNGHAKKGKRQSQPTALIVLSNGVEELEYISIFDVLNRASFKVTTATPQDGLTIAAMFGTKLQVDLPLADALQAGPYDAIVLPGGGKNAQTLGKSQLLISALKDQKANGRLVAAICASPALVLAPNGILDEGQPWTSYPGMGNGADWTDQTVVVNKNIITSQGPATGVDFALKIVAAISGEAAATRVGSGVLFDKYSKGR